MNIECVKTVRELVSRLSGWSIESEQHISNTWKLHVKASNGAEIKTVYPGKVRDFIRRNHGFRRPVSNLQLRSN